MAKASTKEIIEITCYGETKIWADREKAKDFYIEAMIFSDGSEHDRYSNIYEQLCCGYVKCSDEDDF
jgi:hypothetical protein